MLPLEHLCTHLLECRKWGFKRWRLKQIRGHLRKKAIFLCFLDFPGAVQALRKRAKMQKKGRKGRFRPISRTGGQTPLKPPFVTPPFAALQTCTLPFYRGNLYSQSIIFQELINICSYSSGISRSTFVKTVTVPFSRWIVFIYRSSVYRRPPALPPGPLSFRSLQAGQPPILGKNGRVHSEQNPWKKTAC